MDTISNLSRSQDKDSYPGMIFDEPSCLMEGPPSHTQKTDKILKKSCISGNITLLELWNRDRKN